MLLSSSARGSWSVLAAALAAGAAVASVVVRAPERSAGDRRVGQVDEGRPAALARHLERLNALTGQPSWTYLSTPFEINSVAAIAVDANDSSGSTIWVGTGEPNACGSGCEAGVGLYKSTDGGDTWSATIGKAAFNGRGVGSIA